MAEQRLRRSFRIPHQRRSVELLLDPSAQRERRVRRILDSIRQDLDSGGTASVRQILREPRELFRLELELPEMAYQRVTILDRETLAALLEQTGEAAVRERFTFR